MRMIRRNFIMIYLILAAGGFVPTAVASAELASHKAFYVLELAGGVKQGQAITDVRGIVEINHERACDGWTMFEHLRMELTTREGVVLSQDLRFTGWETLDGSTYRFAAKGVSPTSGLDILGKGVKRPGDGEIIFDRPKGERLAVPPDTRFPMSLLGWVVDQASSGKKRIKTHSFDGTDSAGAELVTVFVNGKATPEFSPDLAGKAVLSASGWNMRFAAFAPGQKSSEPAYAYDAVILENGILTEAILEFSDFTVKQTLKRIDELPAPIC